jgi:hypothetical protein
MKKVYEVQNDIDKVKNSIEELKAGHEEAAEKAKGSIKSLSCIKALQEKQINGADVWLDKALTQLDEAIHYLENYETLIETNVK